VRSDQMVYLGLKATDSVGDFVNVAHDLLHWLD
jgi:hypothetical protein